MNLVEKAVELKRIIRELPTAAVAFSGGVDSSLLSRVVYEIQGDQAVALTADSIFSSRLERDAAVQTAEEIGIHHEVVSLGSFDEAILSNPVDRCYHCKKVIFTRLFEHAQSLGKAVLLEGSNLDDMGDYRPGIKAVKELGVRSPLLEAGLTKAEIRTLSQELGLSAWNRPSMACLASRIPHPDRITPESLEMIEQAESCIRELGFDGFRVRKHGEVARIEVSPEDRSRFLDMDLMDQLTRQLKSMGFKFVTLDLEGYRTGSLN